MYNKQPQSYIQNLSNPTAMYCNIQLQLLPFLQTPYPTQGLRRLLHKPIRTRVHHVVCDITLIPIPTAIRHRHIGTIRRSVAHRRIHTHRQSRHVEKVKHIQILQLIRRRRLLRLNRRWKPHILGVTQLRLPGDEKVEIKGATAHIG
jgi:hypothetical protein